MNTKAPINRISAITALLLGVCASSALAQQQNQFSWGLSSDTQGITLTNNTPPGITTITTKNGNAKGRIEITNNRQQNNALSSLLIQTGASIEGNMGLIVVGQNGSYTIPTITNQGTLITNGHPTIHIKETGNKTITNFTNSGTIKNKKQNNKNNNENSAIRFNEGGGTYFVSNFTNSNSGLIKANKRAMALYNTTITSFTNEGTIESNENNAIFLKDSQIKTFINKGLIKSKSKSNDSTETIKLWSGTSVDVFFNSSTIMAQEGSSAGVYLETDENGNKSINIKTLENTGLIQAQGPAVHVGIAVTTEGNGITLLKNSGTLISSKGDGIQVNNDSSLANISKNGSQDKISTTSRIMTLQNSGLIQGNGDGVRVFYDCTAEYCNDEGKSSIGTINNTGTIIGTTGAGIAIRLQRDDSGGDKGIKSTFMTVDKVKVDGLVQGKQAGILNQGQLGSKEGEEAIIVGTNGRIQGGFKNDKDGILQGDITNNGKSELALDNKGKVSNNTVITNSNSSNGGSIKILDWKVENQSNGQQPQQPNGKIKTVQFKGQGITVEKLT
ncbi:MAG: hypothetical protein PUJ79_00475, partial [Helicobacter sp.]|nr:hypothetical protein [Helicobacter sp.]MDY5740686.1 hypothetical protein [Helicobacter sp.]